MPVFQLSQPLVFPPPELAREDGLLAIGGDLSPPRLLLAYRMGIFPWFNPGEPLLWWAPSPRLVLEPASCKISRRLARTIRNGSFAVSFDQSFNEVMKACATVREEKGGGTWIDDRMLAAYTRLHELGHSHSVECWEDGVLAGGLYGVAMGRVFFGESMFSRRPDSSKVALAALAAQLARWQFVLIDCQVRTAHLLRMGAGELPARIFHRILESAVDLAGPPAAAWRIPARPARDYISMEMPS